MNFIPVSLLTAVYLLLVFGMAAFAFHKVKMLALYFWRRTPRPDAVPPPAGWLTEHAPLVCVQCPFYNEALVIEPLLDSLAGLRWPAGRLEIQLLDDSTDETTARVSAWLNRHPQHASRFQLVRRSHRSGYKAGALSHGMTLTAAEYIAIFDADFRPAPDFLENLMPGFVAPDVGLVQARWEFANRKANLLTRFQAIFLDAHFVIEQAARHAAGLFFNFNGTAGIWRRAALDAAGGWTPDTVTEDLDVSYRAQLAGWRFEYRGDYAVPSELPENIGAFKSQQRRWTKGGIQVMRKQLGTILRSSVPSRIKREASWHLLVGFIHPLLISFALLLVPYFLYAPKADGLGSMVQPLALTFTLWATLGIYVAGRQLGRSNWYGSIGILLAAPLVLSIGLAMSVTNCVAVVEGLFQRGGEFVRTPKGGRTRSHSKELLARFRSRALFGAITTVEVAIGMLMLGGCLHFYAEGNPSIALLLGFKATGFLGLAGLSLLDLWPSRTRLA